MTCPDCGFAMDALDVECSRCKVIGKPMLLTTSSEIETDGIDRVIQKTSDFFLYPAGKPKRSKEKEICVRVIDDYIAKQGATNPSEPPPLPQKTLHPQLQAGGWFYAHGGQRIGPVDGDEMQQKIDSGRVTRDTLVWRKDMQDWAMAKLSPLHEVFGSDAGVPPPLVGHAVDNNLAWLIAFAPIISAVIQGAAAATWQVSLLSLWWIAPLLNSFLCLADRDMLEKAGVDTEGLGVWAVFLVPVYLFLRAERLQQSASYAWVWLVTFALTLIPVFVPVIIYQPVPASSVIYE